MNCPACAREVRLGARFCPGCGGPLGVPCPNCAVVADDPSHVALAARVAGAARGGILVSSLVKELADTGEIAFGPPQEVELKGLSGQRRVHEVLWEKTP